MREVREVVQPFLGVWVFDADTADYGEMPVPRSAVYTILAGPEDLWFHVRWTLPDGGLGQDAYRARLDGPVTVPSGGQTLTLTTRVDGDALVSEAHDGRQRVHVARRRIVDGDLHVEQRMNLGDRDVVTNAVYRPGRVKQVLVYRRDLAMRKGKIAAQCAHASMAVFFRRDEGAVDRLSVPLDGPMAAWAKGRFAKVVLSVEGEAELLRVHELASKRGLPCALITDSGKTEFNGVPTRTTVALGPAVAEEIDAVTGPDGLVPTKLA